MDESKESIIIDEVDVSKCKYLKRIEKSKPLVCTAQPVFSDGIILYQHCTAKNNCYYKQLQKQLRRNEDLVYITKKGQDKVTELKKEIEKLKDRIIFEYHGML